MVRIRSRSVYACPGPDKFNYLLNSDGRIVKMVARFFYLASLIHSSNSVS